MLHIDLRNNIFQDRNTEFCVKHDVMTQFHALLAQGKNLMVLYWADIIWSDETP